MISQLEIPPTAEEVNAWITEHAKNLNVMVSTYPDGIRQTGKYIKVPVAIEDKGNAYDHVKKLTEIEDEWDSDRFNGYHLFLVPAPRRKFSKEEILTDLEYHTKHQMDALERIGEVSGGEETAERFRAMRHQSEQMLREFKEMHAPLVEKVV